MARAECPVCADRRHHRGEVGDAPASPFLSPPALPSPRLPPLPLFFLIPLSSTSLYYFTCPPPHFDRPQGSLLLLPRALVARGEGTLLLQTRTLRSRGEVTGQGLPWVRVELGLEQGVRGAQQRLLREESHPQRPAGWSWQAEWLVSQCDQAAGSWAPEWADPTGTAGGPSAQGAAPQEGGGLRERARGGNSCPGRAGLPELRRRDRQDRHTARRGSRGALPASTFSQLPTWPLQWGPQKVGRNEVKLAE